MKNKEKMKSQKNFFRFQKGEIVRYSVQQNYTSSVPQSYIFLVFSHIRKKH